MGADEIAKLRAPMSLKDREGTVRKLQDDMKVAEAQKMALLQGSVETEVITKEIGRFLGSIISDVREVDTGPSSDCLGKYVRVKVAIEVDNSYEWMCHMTRECPIAEKDGPIADEDLLYGASLPG
ncbi:hypothetical protein EZV62_007717 [Acer yangbiense]|uniref:Uncharacterized protein n=1 Tax=Acer yangbiense TaxID=1000413 RepID=A0A5C7ICB3_9ROSI|nr:hypothetical protein EZV62_007717 [Acer yangbiense]